MTLASNLPQGRKTYFDTNGLPLAGGQVTYYEPGTTILAVTYQDDLQTTPNMNPITLDSQGSMTSFGVGQFREYVTDSLGNLLYDSNVVIGTPLIVSDAMLPVLQAATPADAEAILEAGAPPQGHIDIDPGDQSLNVMPTANAFATLSSLNVQGTAANPQVREFLVNLGLDSSVGHGGAAANDKVTLYSGLTANAGTSDVWTLNTCLTMEASSGSYNAQGIELDFNNFNAHRGNSGNLVSDFTAPIANGLSITGAGAFASTVGCAVESEGPGPQWARGFVALGTMGVCAFQDWTTAPVGFQFDGAYSIAAINLTSAYGNAGAVASTALFMKNDQFVAWQNNNTAGVITDTVDGNNNRLVGLPSVTGGTGAVMLCGNFTIPQTTGMGLGSAQNMWGDCYVTNLRLPNSEVLSWQNNPAANSGISAFVFDYVNNTNDRIVGNGASTIFMGTITAPETNGLDLGTPTNAWGNIYSTIGVTTPSDIRLKRDVKPLWLAFGSVLGAMRMVNPIAFNWKAGDANRHYGFNAEEIQTHFPYAAEEHEGIHHIRKDELVAVLWAGIQELHDRIRTLEKRA